MHVRHKKWVSESMAIHNCLSKEIARQLSATATKFVQRRAILKMLLNELDCMDSLIDCAEPSLEDYQWACEAFFLWLEHEDVQLGALMIEKIQKHFGSNHFFVKRMLPILKKVLNLC